MSLERASGTRSSHVVSRQQTACPALRRVGASSCWQAVFELSAAAKSFVVLAGPLSQASAASEESGENHVKGARDDEG